MTMLLMVTLPPATPPMVTIPWMVVFPTTVHDALFPPSKVTFTASRDYRLKTEWLCWKLMDKRGELQDLCTFRKV